MSEKIEVCRVGEDRYRELMDVMDLSFGFINSDSVTFLQLLPKLYKPEYAPWENNMCVLENGRIRAVIGIYYQNLNVCGERLKVGGIGNVCVHPDARGKGYMRLAMDAVTEEMKHNGTDFSFLDGHRQRYRYFGYDTAGYSVNFTVDARNIRHVYGADYQPQMQIEPIADDDSEKQLLVDIGRTAPVHAERSPEAITDLLRSWNNRAFKLRKNGKTVGYFVLERNDANVPEFRVASPEYLKEAVAAIVLSRPTTYAYFNMPACFTAYSDFLASIASGVSLHNAFRISVYRYQRTLNAFFQAKALETVLPDCGCNVLVHGIRGDETLSISVKDGVPSVTSGALAPDLELDHLAAANFFFGLRAPERAAVPGLCPSLPIPAILSSPDHV